MSSTVRYGDPRPLAILEPDERILVKDLKATEDYSLASIYKAWQYVGEGN